MYIVFCYINPNIYIQKTEINVVHIIGVCVFLYLCTSIGFQESPVKLMSILFYFMLHIYVILSGCFFFLTAPNKQEPLHTKSHQNTRGSENITLNRSCGVTIIFTGGI